MPKSRFQNEIDKIAKGGTLLLSRTDWPGEVDGPVQITKPITIEGQGQIVHAKTSPVIHIASSDVHLKNLEVMARPERDGRSSVAVEFEPKTRGFFRRRKDSPPLFEDMVIHGDVAGLDSEAGSWVLPQRSLRLGDLSPITDHEFRIVIQVPVPCRVTSQVDGVGLSKSSLEPGEHEIRLTLAKHDFHEGNYLDGLVFVETDLFRRQFRITGRFNTATGASVSPSDPIFEPPSRVSQPASQTPPQPPPQPAPQPGGPKNVAPPTSPEATPDVVPAPPPSDRARPDHVPSSPGAAFEGADATTSRPTESSSRSTRRRQEVIPMGGAFGPPPDQAEIGLTLAGGASASDGSEVSLSSDGVPIDGLVTKVDSMLDVWGVPSSASSGPKSSPDRTSGSKGSPAELTTEKTSDKSNSKAIPSKTTKEPNSKPPKKAGGPGKIGDAFSN